MTRIIGRTPEGTEIAAWVMACDPAVLNVADEAATSGAITGWHVGESDRLALMKRGDACVLWVLDAAPVEAGIYAVGELTDAADPETGTVACNLQWLARPMTLGALIEQYPGFVDAEPTTGETPNPAILSPSEFVMLALFDQTPGEVGDQQLDDFAVAEGTIDDALFLYANHPDGTSSAILTDHGDLFVRHGDLDEGIDIESAGPFESTVDAVIQVRDRLLAELDAIVMAPEDGDSTPVVACPYEDGVSLLHRFENDQWVEFYETDNGDELDEPVAYDSLAHYFEVFIEDLEAEDLDPDD